MQLDFDLKGTVSKPKPAPKPAEPLVLTVSALTRKVRGLLEDGIGEVWVEGEISNLRRQSSGHAYFTLKDAGSQIACVLFAGQTAQLRGMNFADGVHVQIQGSLTVYEPRGNYQIIVRRVQERGVGALQAKFEELKRRLDAEGLFAPGKKRPLPKFPSRIGVVTSPTGAAIQDFLNVLHRRQRGIEVVIFPVRVQGKGAAAEIAEAIRLLGDPLTTGLPPFDVIVVTRGGGSLEDLWEFNEEAVARAVSESPVPIVSAVGHEIDFSICDFAADFRAPTPSAAAEILSADSGELLDRLQHFAARLGRPVLTHLDGLRSLLLSFQRTALFLEPRRILQEKQQTLDRLLEDLQSTADSAPHQLRLLLERQARVLAGHRPDLKISELSRRLASHRDTLDRRADTRLQHAKSTLSRNAAVLRALNPSAALARGYTITVDESGNILRSASEAIKSKELTTRFHDGEVKSQVCKPTA
jgi:exodeoxyribonuclease VII large subunit